MTKTVPLLDWLMMLKRQLGPHLRQEILETIGISITTGYNPDGSMHFTLNAEGVKQLREASEVFGIEAPLTGINQALKLYYVLSDLVKEHGDDLYVRIGRWGELKKLVLTRRKTK